MIEMVTLWVDAKSAFLEGDFEKAIQHYQALSELGGQTAIYTAKVEYPACSTCPGWCNPRAGKMALEVFVREAPEPLLPERIRLSGMLELRISQSVSSCICRKTFHPSDRDLSRGLADAFPAIDLLVKLLLNEI